MARASNELASFRRTFVLFVTLVVIPSAGLSGFGIVAIKNERAAVEKSLELNFAGTFDTLEQRLARRLEGALAAVAPPPVRGDGQAWASGLHRREPLYGPLFVIDVSGRVTFRESEEPRMLEAEAMVAGRVREMEAGAAGPSPTGSTSARCGRSSPSSPAASSTRRPRPSSCARSIRPRATGCSG